MKTYQAFGAGVAPADAGRAAARASEPHAGSGFSAALTAFDSQPSSTRQGRSQSGPHPDARRNDSEGTPPQNAALKAPVNTRTIPGSGALCLLDQGPRQRMQAERPTQPHDAAPAAAASASAFTGAATNLRPFADARGEKGDTRASDESESAQPPMSRLPERKSADTAQNHSGAWQPDDATRNADGAPQGQPDSPSSAWSGNPPDDAATAPQITVLRQETHLAPAAAPTRTGAQTDDTASEETTSDPETQTDALRSPTQPAATAETRGAVRGHRAASGLADGRLPEAQSEAGRVSMANGPMAEALPLADLQQVADAIDAEAAQLARPARGAAVAPEAQSRGPVRVLELSLSQESLGRLVVRMRLTPTGLDIRLSASNPQTSQMLERDRPALLRLIKADGVALHDLTIEADHGYVAAFTPDHAARRTASAPTDAPAENDRNNPTGGDEGRRRDQESKDEKTPPHFTGVGADLD